MNPTCTHVWRMSQHAVAVSFSLPIGTSLVVRRMRSAHGAFAWSYKPGRIARTLRGAVTQIINDFGAARVAS